MNPRGLNAYSVVELPPGRAKVATLRLPEVPSPPPPSPNPTSVGGAMGWSSKNRSIGRQESGGRQLSVALWAEWRHQHVLSEAQK